MKHSILLLALGLGMAATPARGQDYVYILSAGEMRSAIDQGSGDGKWAPLGSVGQYISKVRPDFDPRLYGHKKLSELFRAHPQLFTVEERGQGEAKSLYVKSVD